jgi:hypothetical protein
LYSGSTQTAGPSSGFAPVTGNLGAVALTPGQQYVLFLTTTTTGVGNGGTGVWGYLGTNIASSGVDGYGGGNFVFNNNSTFASLTSGWENPTFYGGHAADDLAFTLTFVPEPSTLPLLVSGLAIVSGYRRRNGALLRRARRQTSRRRSDAREQPDRAGAAEEATGGILIRTGCGPQIRA